METIITETLFATLVNTVFVIIFMALYVFIGFSAGLTSHHEGIWAELGGWLILLICIALHVIIFTRIWRKKDKRSYVVGLFFAFVEYAYLILDAIIAPG